MTIRRQRRFAPGRAALLEAVARIWPLAAKASDSTTDATDHGDEEGAAAKRVEHDSLNAPIGRLTGAFLEACPNLAESPHPFEVDIGLRKIRDLVASTQGHPGMVARYRCAGALPWFMQADGAWTEAILLSRLEAGPESDVLWRAVAHSRHTRNVMTRLGRMMAGRAASAGLTSETRQSLADRVCYSVLGNMLDGRSDEGMVPHAQQMLRRLPDDLRASAARAVENFVGQVAGLSAHTPPAREAIFDRAVEPFLRIVWPQERTAVTPAIAEAMASIPAVCGRRFAEAVVAIRRFLVPFEAWSMHDWALASDDVGRIKPDAIIGAAEAAATLELLDLTIGANADVRVPQGLDVALAHIETQDAALRRDPRFARLSALARR